MKGKDTWYTGSGIFALAVVLALAAYGFHTTVADRRGGQGYALLRPSAFFGSAGAGISWQNSRFRMDPSVRRSPRRIRAGVA
jgi:hypothetical protein